METANKTSTCPICGSAEHSILKFKKNYDLEKLDAFGFASRKRPEFMHYDLMECLDCGVLYATALLSKIAQISKCPPVIARLC